MRTKEGSSDYRYFTEPDLLPLVFAAETIDRLHSELPESTGGSPQHGLEGMGVEAAVARVLAMSEPELRNIFAEAVAAGADPGQAANWVTGELTAAFRKTESP